MLAVAVYDLTSLVTSLTTELAANLPIILPVIGALLAFTIGVHAVRKHAKA